MTSKSQAIGALANFFQQLEPKRLRIRGILGYPGSATVEVSDRDGYVYFQEDGNPSKVSQIFNNKVAPIKNLPVVAGLDSANPKMMQVLDIDMGALPDWEGRSFPQPHHKSHELNSADSAGNALDTDVVFVRKGQVVPLALRPNNPYDYSLYVYPDWYWYGSELKRWAGGATQNYAIPTVEDTAYYVLTSLDENNTLHYITGNTFSPSLGITGSRDYIPDPNLGTYPLGAVYLPFGDVSLDYDNIEFIKPYSFTPAGHLRLTGVSITGGPFVLPSGTGISGGSGQVGQLAFDTDDDVLYVHNGSAWSDVSSTVVVDDVTKTVGDGKDFTTIQDAVDWFKNKLIVGSCKIAVDAGTYDEAIVFEDLFLGKFGSLELEGDTKVLAGLSYVSCNPSATAWAGTTVYGAASEVSPTAGQNGFFYYTVAGGTSAGGEPTWPTTIGGTVIDNDITWVCMGVLANQAGLANGGSGSCQINLDGGRTNIIITCSIANPDFDADGWNDTDKILIYMSGGATYERELTAVVDNVLTIDPAIPAGPSFIDGSAICLMPNREIDRTTAGSCIEVDSVRGILVDGFYLESATGANCHGVFSYSGAAIELQNCAINVEDYGIYLDQARIKASSGAVSVWGANIGVLVGQNSDIFAQYVVSVNNTYGFYSSLFALITLNYAIITTGTYGVYSSDFSDVYAPYVTVRYGTTGYYAVNSSFINASATNINNYGNTTDYNPAPGIPGSAQGNHYAVIYAS